MIIGGAKKGFCPHPNYWGARARAAPQSLRLWMYGVKEFNQFVHPPMQPTSTLQSMPILPIHP